MILKTRRKTFVAIAIILIVAGAVAGDFIIGAKSRTRSYYYGDAVSYHGRLVVATTNMGAFEVFVLRDGELARESATRSFRSTYGGFEEFKDVSMREENGRLYAYLIDGTYLYKYDITNPQKPVLDKQMTDNTTKWFTGLEQAGDRLVTVGLYKTNVWNNDLEIVDSFKVGNNFERGLTFGAYGDRIVYFMGNYLNIFDTRERRNVAGRQIASNGGHNRSVYEDTITGSIYFVDDEGLKKIDGYANIDRAFYHISDVGYDVDAVDGAGHVYFTDGIGVVKSSKDDLRPLDWAFTTNLGSGNGWAIGLEAVRDAGGEKVVVFNNSSILVFNENLDLLADYASSVEDYGPAEGLSLGADKIRAPINSMVSLHGAGYSGYEPLTIILAGKTYYANADQNGRFITTIQVPEAHPQRTDIKVTGDITGLTYSLGFEIE